MWKTFRHWWIEDLFGPRRKSMFVLRIRARIMRLRFQLWWRRPKAAVIRHHWPKPAALLLVGVLVPILTGWLLSIVFPAEARGFSVAVHNLLTKPDEFRLEWREAAQLLLLVVGIPSAFLLWLFRDINVSGTLANQRKDVNLKEFQEIQMRAAGAMDEKLPASARETLQIAALHQLRTFLRGEYGASFRRPAFELLRARFVASAEAIGTQAVRDWLEEWHLADEADVADLWNRIEAMKGEVAWAMGALNPSRVAETERSVIQEEWEAIFRSGLPLAGTVFDKISLSNNTILAGTALAGCRFIGASLAGVHLENARLFNADFAFANLYQAHLERADLWRARFEGAQLHSAHLERADLREARLDGANLSRAHLNGADLGGATLVGAFLNLAELKNAKLAFTDLRCADFVGANLEAANLMEARLQGAVIRIDPAILSSCKYANFDDATEFADDWDDCTGSERERDAARAPWLERGAQWAKA